MEPVFREGDPAAVGREERGDGALRARERAQVRGVELAQVEAPGPSSSAVTTIRAPSGEIATLPSRSSRSQRFSGRTTERLRGRGGSMAGRRRSAPPRPAATSAIAASVPRSASPSAGAASGPAGAGGHVGEAARERLLEQDAGVGDVVEALPRVALEAATQHLAGRARRLAAAGWPSPALGSGRRRERRSRSRRRRAAGRSASPTAPRRRPRCRRACPPACPAPARATCRRRCRG